MSITTRRTFIKEASMTALGTGLVLSTGSLPAQRRGPSCPGNCPDNKADVGCWLPCTAWPEAIHASVMPTGVPPTLVAQVLVWAKDDSSAKLWNPDTGVFTDVPLTRNLCTLNPTETLDCSQGCNFTILSAGHNFLQDGRLLVVSGLIIDRHDRPKHEHGPLETFLFNPLQLTPGWSQAACLNDPVVGLLRGGRFYPTNVTLRRPVTDPEARVLTFSGLNVRGRRDDLNNTVERYTPGSFPNLGTWETVSTNIPIDRTAQLYPRLHPLPSQNTLNWPAGLIFYSGGEPQAYKFDPVQNTWAMSGPAPSLRERREGTSVLLPLQLDVNGHVTAPGVRVLVAGGEDPTKTPRITNTAESFVDGNPDGQWFDNIPPMTHARRYLNAVLLPDGTVLVVGGEHEPAYPDPQCRPDFQPNPLTPVYEAERYDPTPNTWTPLPAMDRPRQYHSVALLLPDGSVLVAGGETDAFCAPGGPTAQIYQPGYFFRGERPGIDSSTPLDMSYNAEFTITLTPNQAAARIDRVYLIRPASVTHAFDAAQRMLSLPIVSRPRLDQVRVKTPARADIATPGYYMLFIVWPENGLPRPVPSKAKFVRLQ